MRKFKKTIFIVFGLFIFVFLGVFLLNGKKTYSFLDNDVEVAENSELTYYIDVIYDGVGGDGITSGDTNTSDLTSEKIYVEDKIPEGLTFLGFDTGTTGTIGAVRRDDESIACSGYVVDGEKGLKYDETTRTVSFYVDSLQAGCKLTVGVKTRTPSLEDEERLDFYNQAVATEKVDSALSNTVHVYIGSEEENLYTVHYEYVGEVPKNASSLPSDTSYSANSEVSVATDGYAYGYTFSGWTSEDISITNNVFTMPNHDVTLVGHFEKLEPYKVSYQIDGVQPEGYVKPDDENFYAKENVKVDSLSYGTIINGYRFLGWKSEEVIPISDEFFMPEQDVLFVGKFEKVDYEVRYQFLGDIPDNALDLLPKPERYSEGETVTRKEALVLSGYQFLGWYIDETFIMPGHDVVVYGEWKKISGNFQPEIKKEIVNFKEYFHENDVVEFKITVKNTADYPIKDILIEESLAGVEFSATENFELLSSNIGKIHSLEGNSSIDIYATYKVGNETVGKYTNTVRIIGAVASNDYVLDPSKEYMASVQFQVSNISLFIDKRNSHGDKISGSEFILYKDEGEQQEIGRGLEFKNLLPNTVYYLKEIKAPDGYQLLDKNIKVQVFENGEIQVHDDIVSNSVVQIVNARIGEILNPPQTFEYVWYTILLLIIVGLIFAILITLYKRVKKR